MDQQVFLQHLGDLSFEEGKAYIQEHIEKLSDYVAIGNLIADKARRLLYTPFVSLKLAELLIFYGEYVNHTLSHALGLKAKGDALLQIGHYQAAIQCLDASGDEFLRFGDSGNWARSRISWIVSTAWLGRAEEALKEAVRARSVFEQLGEWYWVCVINNNTAMIYDHLGRYKEALKLYESTQSIYPTLTDRSETSIKRSIAIAQVNQALDLALLGNFENACYLQQQALTSFIMLEETDLIITTEVNLADIDYMQGYYGSALRRYYQASDILARNEVNNPLRLAELKLYMAKCLVKLNRAHDACLLSNEAVEIYRRAGTPLSTGEALSEYAVALVASERLEEALITLDEAWKLFNYGGFESHASAIKFQQSELLLKMGSFADAYTRAFLSKEYFDAQELTSRSVQASLVMIEALIESIKQASIQQDNEQQIASLHKSVSLCRQVTLLARRHNLQEQVYKGYYLLGQLYFLQGETIKATRYYGAAIAQIERMLDDLSYDLSPSFLRTTWAVYENMIALCIQQSEVERAFSYLEQARSRALQQYLNKSNFVQVTREESQGEASLNVSQLNNAAILRMQRELKDWQEQYRDYSVLLSNIDTSVSPSVRQEVIQSELKRCEAKISELFERLSLYQPETLRTLRSKRDAKQHIKLFEVTQLRQQLVPDQLLLAYFLYQGKLVIFAVTAEKIHVHEIPDGMAQLERLLLLLHARLLPISWPNPQRPQQQHVRGLLEKLYKLLIAPIASLLPSMSGFLTIVPYGPLHSLPFHALYDGSHFLIENFQINYLPASNVLMHTTIQKHEQRTHYVNNVNITKQPLTFGFSDNGQLQRAVEEAKSLATMLKGTCYLEEEATIDRLMKEAAGSSIIHIATHGHSRLDAPNFSSVLLADGRLNAIDAFTLNLKDCELVTLSGCETGLALSGGGDEQLGLGRAFLAAGTKSLVMSLWPVEDNATSELMQLFYQRLLNGESKVQALRAAQCQLLQRIDSIYTHPYFWAAFRLVGDVSPLQRKEQNAVLSSAKLSR